MSLSHLGLQVIRGYDWAGCCSFVRMRNEYRFKMRPKSSKGFAIDVQHSRLNDGQVGAVLWRAESLLKTQGHYIVIRSARLSVPDDPLPPSTYTIHMEPRFYHHC